MGKTRNYKDDDFTASTAESSDSDEVRITKSRSKRQQRRSRVVKKSSRNDITADLLSLFECCVPSICVPCMDDLEPDDEEDLFAEDDNFLSKVGHSLLHKVGFAPPVRIISCTKVDDDSVITMPIVLEKMALEYDREQKFWKLPSTQNELSTFPSNIPSSKPSNDSSSQKKRLLPTISLPTTGKSFITRSTRSSKSTKSTKSNKSSRSIRAKKSVNLPTLCEM